MWRKGADVTDRSTLSPIRGSSRPRTKAVTQDTRAHNRALVLQTLYREGAMSRSDLARTSKLTAPTISALVAELEAEGLVTDIGLREEPRIGKPATLVQIDDDARYVIAIDVSGTQRFTGALVNLRGAVVNRAEVPAVDVRGERAVELVVELAEKLRALTTRPVLGIGVGSPGIIDPAGVVLEAVKLSWVDLPLAGRIGERTGLPTHVGNDVNLEALGVYHFRPAFDQDLMVVSIEHGVGVGLMIGGRLVEGARFAAGEIGHVTVVEADELCHCGRRGCLEMLLSATHLARRCKQVPPSERDRPLREAGNALGVVLAPIVSALNLGEVVITGPTELIDGPLLQAVTETTRARTLPSTSDGLSIRSLIGESELTMLGAAALVLSAELGVM